MDGEDDSIGSRQTDTVKEQGAAASESFASKLSTSTSGLLRDTFSQPISEAHDVLSQRLNAAGKSNPSTGVSTPGYSYDGGSSAASASSLSGPPSSYTADHVRESFRSPALRSDNSVDTRGMTLDQFVQEDNGLSEPDLKTDNPFDKGKRIAIESPVEVSHLGNELSHFEPVQEDSLQAATDVEGLGRKQKDGMEVVALLSDPSYQPEFWREETPEQEVAYTISAAEMEIAQQLIQHLSGRFVARSSLTQPGLAARNGESYEKFGSFFDDIEHYQEDVWGYIRPLVLAARMEAQSTSVDSTDEGPAVRRLRMILTHTAQLVAMA